MKRVVLSILAGAALGRRSGVRPVEGFFVKMVTREKGKSEPLTTMELTKPEKNR